MLMDNYGELLTRAAETSVEIAAEYDGLWNSALGLSEGSINLYGALCTLGLYFALATLIFMILKMYSDLQEGRSATLVNFIIPLIVGLLLFNNGNRLAVLTLEIREVINNVNNDVLTTTIEERDLNQNLQLAVAASSANDEVSKFFRQCTSLQGEDLGNCLREALSQSYSLFTIFNSVLPSNLWMSMRTSLEIFESAINNNEFNAAFPGLWVSPSLSDFFSPLLVPLWQSTLFAVLIAMSQGYQHALELSLLLTALLGPLAVGGSLLPLGAGLPAFAWLTGFFSLAIAKLSFNIILGLIAVVMNSQAATLDNMWFPTVLGLFAPILASALAAGGGIAIWQSLISAAQNTADGAFKIIEAIPFIQ